MLDALRERETWLGRPAARGRWLVAGVVVGLVVAVFHAPPTAYALADLGLPTGWGAAGFALCLAVGAGADGAGVLVGVAAARLSAAGWIAPGVAWPSPMETHDPLWVLSRWARDVGALGLAGYLVGAGVRHVVGFVRSRVGQAASGSSS